MVLLYWRTHGEMCFGCFYNSKSNRSHHVGNIMELEPPSRPPPLEKGVVLYVGQAVGPLRTWHWQPAHLACARGKARGRARRPRGAARTVRDRRDDSTERGLGVRERVAVMKRAPIPPPPCVVAGMLSKSEMMPPKCARSGSGSSSADGASPPPSPVVQAVAPSRREISGPPVLSYADQNLTANGL